MPDVLDYGRPERLRPALRSLLVGGAVQVLAILLTATCLDEGGALLATARLSAAYWAGVIVVLVRRSNTLTDGDHRYFRFGLLPVLVVGGPVTLALWTHWGVV